MRLSIAFLFLSIPVIAQDPTQHLHALTATERAFAAATRHIGVRNGFLTFFADDAIGFRPVYGAYKPELMKRPQPPQPLPNLLLWTPTEGDVSGDGSLGWLTGPSAVRENKPGGKDLYHGLYFSVWKKQSDGTWKVLLDAGIEVPSLTGDPETAAFQPHALFSAEPDTAVRGTTRELADAELALNDAFQRSGETAVPFYASSARYHADGLLPVTGPDAVRAFIRTRPASAYQSLVASSATSGDLGYSYGTCVEKDKTIYYIRAWKFVREGGWRVVVEWVG